MTPVERGIDFLGTSLTKALLSYLLILARCPSKKKYILVVLDFFFRLISFQSRGVYFSSGTLNVEAFYTTFLGQT